MQYWLDCEFDGYGGRLLSLALVSEDGGEFYWVTSEPSPLTDPWVSENVAPLFYCQGAQPTSGSLAPGLAAFFAQTDAHTNAHIIADWPDDVAYFCRALLTGPGKRIDTPPLTFELVRLDAYPTALPGAIQHNALWDARALRHFMRSPVIWRPQP